MKQKLVKCYCDYCNKEMSEWEYDCAIKIAIGITVPSPGQKCGAYNGLNMTICNECAKELGITKHDIHNDNLFYTAEKRLFDAIEKCKKKIVDMFFKKQEE